MIKLNALALLFFCGVVIIQEASTTCPEFLLQLAATCPQDVVLGFPTHLDCSSSSRKCLTDTALGNLGLPIGNTEYNSISFANKLVNANIPSLNIDDCVFKVGELANAEGADLIVCQTYLNGAFLICLLEDLICTVLT